MSKIVSKNNKNVNSSLKDNLKSSIPRNDLGAIKESNEKLNINMLDEDNIYYLWYMEEKKRNNKSFNYKISDDYNELFTDYKNN